MKTFSPSLRWRGIVIALFLGAGCAAATEPFKFAALGCVPYGRVSDSRAAFLRLIAEINRQNPAFTVHLGDILGSDEPVADDVLRQRLADFNAFTGPLVYTPGDNEWTDSHTAKAGSYDPLERLARLRELFFANERSLGREPMPLITQRRDRRYAKFVENARWNVGGVIFATVHLVGSSNNDQPAVPGAVGEWRERDAANEAWVRAAFAEARATGAPGVALFFQADPFAADRGRTGYARGFERFLKVTGEEARAFAKPVLLVHADEHRYRLDVGIRFEAALPPVPNVARLETFGEQNVHGVLVTVDPESRDVFLCGPLIVPGTRPPRLPSAQR